MSLREIAYERAQIKFMESCYIEHFRLCRKHKDWNKLPGSMQGDTFRELLHDIELYTSKNMQKFNMLTISPRDGILHDWTPLKRVVEMIVSRTNLLIEPMWCFEQRSEAVLAPSGFHVHIAYKSKQSRSEVIRRVFSDLGKVFDEPEKNWIHVNIDSPKAYEYIQGDKISEKEAKIIVDKDCRKRYNLKDYYELENET